MALGFPDITLWLKLDELGVIPQSPAVLEIGEANWYGDYPLERMLADIEQRHPERADAFRAELHEITTNQPGNWLFEIAQAFYRALFAPRAMGTIDLNGTARAHKHDLNLPFASEPCDLVINTGTAEHIFEVAQVFRSIHAACAVGGLMVHTFPFRGWQDHGFWAINPTLIHDLEAANDYERIACLYYESPDRMVWLDHPSDDLRAMREADELGSDSLLHLAWRKTTAATFRTPLQGHYVAMGAAVA